MGVSKSTGRHFSPFFCFIEPEEGEEIEGDLYDYFESGRIMKGKSRNTVYISATKKFNVDQLRELIFKSVKKQHLKIYPNYLAPKTYS